MRTLISILLAWAALAMAQDSVPRRVRDMFYDPSSTSMIPVPAPATAKGAPGPVQVPSSVGLLYRVQLLGDGGEISQVSVGRAFRSGERIRLELTSNVAGRLTVLQSVDGGPDVQLFPGPSTAAEESVIRAHTPQIIPRRGFRFDDKPGKVTLTVRVDPEVRVGSPGSSLAVVPPVPDIAETRELAHRATRALVLEEDDGSVICVLPTATDRPLEALVRQIDLNHAR